MSETPGRIAFEAFRKSEGGFTWPWERSIKQQHWEAAASAVLEEAAKVADVFADRIPKCCESCGVGQDIEQVADAIRALKHGD